MEGTLKVLTRQNICRLNRRLIAEFGGSFLEADDNLLNPNSLDHVLGEITTTYYGIDLYPSIIEKAAILGWRIIKNHIFHDGNKRTGIAACQLFLLVNGMRLDLPISDANPDSLKQATGIALSIADNSLSFPEFVDWLRKRTSALSQT